MKNDKLKTILITLAFLFLIPTISTGSNTKSTNIIPIPVSIEHRDGFFVINSSTQIIARKNAEKREASKLIDTLSTAMGYRLNKAA